MAKKPKKYGVTINKTNTLLIDGNALFKLGFHGAKDQYSWDGNHIGGLYQFITILRRRLMNNLYHKVFVFWDGEFSGKMRYKHYSDYKIGRGKDYLNGTHPVDPQEKREKFLISQYLEELCIRQHIDNSDIGVEGDDFIAHYCLTKEKNEKITIVTTDRDLCQLISNDITIYLLDIKVYITPKNYNVYFKHHHENSKLIKIISGDYADSIKGIKGVKETTLLKYFPELIERKVELEEIIDSAKRQQKNRLKDKKKPLKAFTNIINGITDGVQGTDIYKINELIIDLSKPLIDSKNIKLVTELKNPIGDMDKRGIKNVYKFMKRDGIDKLIYNFSTNYLLPFKELIEREKRKLI